MADDAPSFQSDDVITGAAQGRLKSFVERIERLDEDEAVVKADRKEVFAEAKGEGFDVRILRKVIRLRKQDKAKLSEEEAMIDLYMGALENVQPRLIITEVSRKPRAETPPVARLSVEQACAIASDNAAADGNVGAAVKLKMTELTIREAREFVSRLDRAFTIRDVETGLCWTRDKTHVVLSALEEGGVITKADAKGLRRMVRNPDARQSSDDKLYQDAVGYVRNDRKASTSYIQRKLQIGYNLAASLIERMERDGVIGPANHVGKRDILMGPL